MRREAFPAPGLPARLGDGDDGWMRPISDRPDQVFPADSDDPTAALRADERA